MKGRTRKLEVLVAAQNIRTMEQLPKVVRQASEKDCSVLLINQTESETAFESPADNLRIFNYSESGISRSRNRSLQHAEGEILLITDDDVELLEGFSSVIIEAFDKNPEADVITFQCLNEWGLKRKKYSDSVFWHNARSLLKVSSVEIALRHDSFIENPLFFDERFGLGGQFQTGGETVFLSDALSKGMKILFIPSPIVRHPDASSGRALYHNSILLKAKGAMFRRIFGWKAYGACSIFAMKKRGETGLSPIHALRLMYEGIRELKATDHEK